MSKVDEYKHARIDCKICNKVTYSTLHPKASQQIIKAFDVGKEGLTDLMIGCKNCKYTYHVPLMSEHKYVKFISEEDYKEQSFKRAIKTLKKIVNE